METVTITTKEYSELIELRRKLDRLLKMKKEKTSLKEDGFLNAFGVLKRSFRDDSLIYISKLRKGWRR